MEQEYVRLFHIGQDMMAEIVDSLSHFKRVLAYDTNKHNSPLAWNQIYEIYL